MGNPCLLEKFHSTSPNTALSEAYPGSTCLHCSVARRLKGNYRVTFLTHAGPRTRMFQSITLPETAKGEYIILSWKHIIRGNKTKTQTDNSRKKAGCHLDSQWKLPLNRAHLNYGAKLAGRFTLHLCARADNMYACAIKILHICTQWSQGPYSARDLVSNMSGQNSKCVYKYDEPHPHKCSNRQWNKLAEQR